MNNAITLTVGAKLPLWAKMHQSIQPTTVTMNVPTYCQTLSSIPPQLSAKDTYPSYTSGEVRNVRLGSLADIRANQRDVRFTPKRTFVSGG